MKVLLAGISFLILTSCAYENPSSLPEGKVVVPPIQALKMCADPERWDPKWCQKL